jgi:hypothetical protein
MCILQQEEEVQYMFKLAHKYYFCTFFFINAILEL